MQLRSRAAANVVRGVFGSLPTAFLAPILARQLSSDDLAVWVLVVQIATYVTYLEFGVQTAMVRTTAAAFARGDRREAEGSISAGLGLLIVGMVIGTAVIGALCAVLPSIFDLERGSVTDARQALLILGLTAALALPGSAVHGALLGSGHHWDSASIVACTRLASATVVVALAVTGHDLTTLAWALGAGSLASSALAHVAARLRGIHVQYRLVDRGTYRRVGSIVVTLGIGNVAMLLISGIDVLVVGVVDFDHVQAYSLATTLILIYAAGFTMVGAALIPGFAELEARDDDAGVRRLLSRSSVFGSFALATGLILILGSRFSVLDRWAGSYAEDAIPVYVILAIAQAVRLSHLPISALLQGGRFHRLARRTVVVEAVVNVVCSVGLGLAFGYVGVALGTLAGAVPPLVIQWWNAVAANLDRTYRRILAINAYARPAAIALIGGVLIALTPALPSALISIGTAIALLVVFPIANRVAISAAQRPHGGSPER